MSAGVIAGIVGIVLGVIGFIVVIYYDCGEIIQEGKNPKDHCKD